jgi:hypothetical protein
VTWTSGTGWATTPSKVQMFGPGVHKPGEVVQKVSALITTTTGANTTFTQSTLTASITPSSTVNLVSIDAIMTGQTAANQSATVQISRGTTPTLIGMGAQDGGATIGAKLVTLPLKAIDQPASTSAVAYYVYGKVSTSGFTMGSAIGSYIELNEVMGALELDKIVPANDDAGPPLRLVG